MVAAPDSTRERLLFHARDLYLAGGTAAVSVREVARRAGVSAAAVYRHFDGRNALLATVCEAGFHRFATYLMRCLSARTPRERILGCSAQYLAFGLEHPQDYRVMFLSPAEEVAVFLPKGGPEAAPTFQFLVDRVRECQEAGVLRAGEPTAAALAIWAHVHGLVSLWISGQLAHGRSEAQFRSMYHGAVQRLLEGMATPGAF